METKTPSRQQPPKVVCDAKAPRAQGWTEWSTMFGTGGEERRCSSTALTWNVEPTLVKFTLKVKRTAGSASSSPCSSKPVPVAKSRLQQGQSDGQVRQQTRE